MVWLALCVLLTTGLFVWLRACGQWGLRILPVITVNYWVCVGCAWLYAPADAARFADMFRLDRWTMLGLLQGSLFIAMFWLIGLGTVRLGVGRTTVLTKLSVVLPFSVSVLLLGETTRTVQLVGVGLALVAVVLLHGRNASVASEHKFGGGWLLAAALFVGTGWIDTNFKLFAAWYGPSVPTIAFTTLVFAVAASMGTLAVLRNRLRNERPSWREVGAGVVLGIPNFFSVLVLLRGLAELPASVFFPANNIGQLVLAALTGMVLFRERFQPVGWLGLGLAVAAILLVL